MGSFPEPRDSGCPLKASDFKGCCWTAVFAGFAQNIFSSKAQVSSWWKTGDNQGLVFQRY